MNVARKKLPGWQPKRQSKWQSRRQSGLASVELTLVTPFLLVMMLLAGEFTRLFMDYNTLTKGVRDAARLAVEVAYNGANQFELSDGKIAAARNLVVFGNSGGTGSPLLDGLETSQVSVVQVNLGTAPLIREHVEVTVAYPITIDVPGLGFLSTDYSDRTFTLTASSTMRAL